MSEDVKISGPVNIQPDSRERVAFDLMKIIAQDEGLPMEKRTREYWLTLYNHCGRVLHMSDRHPEQILQGWQLPK